MAQLVPCPECHRHVRASDAGCPFCGRDLADLPPPPPYEPARLRGLGRAALFALGATLSAGAVGCDADPAPSDSGPGMDAGPVAVDSGPAMFDAAYGGPPFDAGPDEDAGEDAGPVAAYGGPPVDGGP
jgi:hypothetical protein